MPNPTLPPPFVQQMQALLPNAWPLLESALQTPPPVSIRLNPRKWTATLNPKTLQIGQNTVLTQAVPWHPAAFYLSERPVFTLDPHFHAGAYYVQEASSMFVSEALRQTVDFSKPLIALDLCAAPGGKSTAILDLLSNDSLLVANETIRTRTAPLRENLERWGNPNIAVTSAEVEAYAELKDCFDIVLADAPCSGEGLFRKDPEAMREWSLPQVEFCAGRQKRILAAAVQTLAPGGILIFSTCTYNAQENTENAAWLTETFDLEPISLQIPAEWGIEPQSLGYQFYPHKLQGEGFFIAVFRKKIAPALKHSLPTAYKSIKPLNKASISSAEKWLSPNASARFFLSPSEEVLALPATLEKWYLLLDKFLKTKWFGTPIGIFKGKDFVPSHALALSNWGAPEVPTLALTREQALLFLKKETFDPPEQAPLGWTLATFEGHNLGWVKVLPNRLNNYLPQERRIRMSIHQTS